MRSRSSKSSVAFPPRRALTPGELRATPVSASAVPSRSNRPPAASVSGAGQAPDRTTRSRATRSDPTPRGRISASRIATSRSRTPLALLISRGQSCGQRPTSTAPARCPDASESAQPPVQPDAAQPRSRHGDVRGGLQRLARPVSQRGFPGGPQRRTGDGRRQPGSQRSIVGFDGRLQRQSAPAPQPRAHRQPGIHGGGHVAGLAGQPHVRRQIADRLARDRQPRDLQLPGHARPVEGAVQIQLRAQDAAQRRQSRAIEARHRGHRIVADAQRQGHPILGAGPPRQLNGPAPHPLQTRRA